eukprot:TRINITY_DN5887_c0_g1_i8.p1 TRINITY_DN5887_c0_g1~~TRINITY_DN5887_c0_g1_i8.p1  ORF type:complete len:182 (-),score=50.69 TRINITY_DN5887_c0_g1_i8:197-742(-)
MFTLLMEKRFSNLLRKRLQRKSKTVESKLCWRLNEENSLFQVLLRFGQSLGKKKEGEGKSKKRPMSMEYILEAMQHHGLGHMPQPDNFTTCGQLGIEINQYNNPVECYADGTIEDMREEKVIMDFPDIADKLIEMNTQKHKDLNPACAQKMKRFDPGRSAVLSSLVEVEKQAKENAGSAGV